MDPQGKRLLIVTPLGALLPSAVVRAMIYKDVFRADGTEVRYVACIPPAAARVLNRLRRVAAGVRFRRFASVLDHGLRRTREKWITHLARRFDVVYLQKTGSLSLIEALRKECKARLIYDLNDALWLPARRSHTGDRLGDILGAVDAVTADNNYLCRYAAQLNPRVFWVPDCPQLELFDLLRTGVERSRSRVILGWVGSSATAFNLFAIWEALELLFQRFDNLDLRLVGVGQDPNYIPMFEKVSYSAVSSYGQTEMVREVLSMHIGLFPLFDVEDSWARGVLKATVYMCGGACVVTRAIGDCRSLIRHGVNGVFAETPAEWLDHLTELVSDGERRERIAQAGLETMRKDYTLDACYSRLRQALFW